MHRSSCCYCCHHHLLTCKITSLSELLHFSQTMSYPGEIVNLLLCASPGQHTSQLLPMQKKKWDCLPMIPEKPNYLLLMLRYRGSPNGVLPLPHKGGQWEQDDIWEYGMEKEYKVNNGKMMKEWKNKEEWHGSSLIKFEGQYYVPQWTE